MRSFTPPLAWLFLVTALSLIPNLQIDATDWGLGWEQGKDEMGHAALYTVLTLLALRSTYAYRRGQYPRLRFRLVGLVVLAAVGYGAVLEVVQWRLVPGRFGSWSDCLANALGALLGALLTAPALWACRRIAASKATFFAARRT
jgi:hypothetical protein